jgi:hypothetical protein
MKLHNAVLSRGGASPNIEPDQPDGPGTESTSRNPVTVSDCDGRDNARRAANMDGSSYRLAGIECAADRLFCVAPLASLGGGVEPGWG